MTDRERVEALLRREKPDRVPVWPFAYDGFSVVNAGYSIADAYNNPEKSLQAQRRCCEQYGWVFVPCYAYAAFGGWEFGGDIKLPSSEFDQAPSITRYPVENEEDAWNLKIPDVKTGGSIPIMTALSKLAFRETLDNEPFNFAATNDGPFTIVGNICGIEKLCRWTVKKPSIVHHLLRLATDYLLQLAKYWKDSFGIEGVLPFVGEVTTSNQVISPKMFKEFAYPYVKELHEGILSLGYRHIYCHICGEQNDNLPFWKQIPMGDPGIISIGHEIDIATAAEFFPNDIILGNIDPVIVQEGTPQEVYQASRVIIEKGKNYPSSFIFSPGCSLPPRAPSINATMLTKAATDFGWVV